MAGTKVTIPVTFRTSHDMAKYSCWSESDPIMIFGFLEGEDLPESECSSGESNNYDGIDFEDDTEDENVNNAEENKAFWESQDQLLQATLCKSSSIESKVRQATKEAVKELKLAGSGCTCRRAVVNGCRNCPQREISERLRVAGYNCAICKSKWRSSPHIISGEHTYLEVVDNSNPKKGEVRVVIELNFRAEFEVARASEEYNRLINRLPEVFVGKAERLRGLIKIMCSAAKKSMKDNKMHMGPWRKHKHMQAKWVASLERTTLAPVQILNRRPKPRASMLTFDLVANSGVKVV